MGLSGLALAWKQAVRLLAFKPDIHLLFAVLAGLVFIVLAGVYLLKLLRHRAQVKMEFLHPVKANFFPAVSISLVLLAALVLDQWPALGRGMFALGAVMHLAFTLLVFSRWIFTEGHQNPHLTPAWFIPVVGNVLMPIVAAPLGYYEIGWFFFSIGIVFWVVLFTILMHRLIFLDPMPAKLTPTLFILIAPPAVAFVSYLKLNGYMDNFAQVLYGVALFITLFLLLQVRQYRKVPFSISWWAYSFPLAAITIASLTYFEQTHYRPVYWIGISLLALATVVIAGLFLRTLVAMIRGQICVPE